MIVDLLYTGFVFTRLRPPVYDSWQTLDNWNISENQFFFNSTYIGNSNIPEICHKYVTVVMFLVFLVVYIIV